jgi:hypothetical protein
LMGAIRILMQEYFGVLASTIARGQSGRFSEKLGI